MSGHIREKSLASETVSEYKKYEKKEDWRSVMRYGMYTLGRNSMERFREVLPEYVLANCGRNGVFVVGAAAKDGRIIGLTQFFVRMLPKDDAVADIVYVYVVDEFRGNGVASRMIAEIHKIMKKSGGEKCLALLKKKQKEQQMFEKSGYLFMKTEADTIGFLEEVHEDPSSALVEQGVYYINR